MCPTSHRVLSTPRCPARAMGTVSGFVAGLAGTATCSLLLSLCRTCGSRGTGNPGYEPAHHRKERVRKRRPKTRGEAPTRGDAARPRDWLLHSQV